MSEKEKQSCCDNQSCCCGCDCTCIYSGKLSALLRHIADFFEPKQK